MRVYTGGTFDLFHAGHVAFLRSISGLTVPYPKIYVALNTDEYVERLKGKRPVMTYDERLDVLEACRFVHWVLPNNGNERELLGLVKPHQIVYANDGSYTRLSYMELLGIDGLWLSENNCKLLFTPYTEGVSSSDIVDRIRSRDRGESRQRAGTPQDAREPDVPDAPSGRRRCPCEWPDSSVCCRAPGGLPGRAIPCS